MIASRVEMNFTQEPTCTRLRHHVVSRKGDRDVGAFQNSSCNLVAHAERQKKREGTQDINLRSFDIVVKPRGGDAKDASSFFARPPSAKLF